MGFSLCDPHLYPGKKIQPAANHNPGLGGSIFDDVDGGVERRCPAHRHALVQCPLEPV